MHLWENCSCLFTLTPNVPNIVVTFRLDCHLYSKMSEMKALQRLITLLIIIFTISLKLRFQCMHYMVCAMKIAMKNNWIQLIVYYETSMNQQVKNLSCSVMACLSLNPRSLTFRSISLLLTGHRGITKNCVVLKLTLVPCERLW